MSHIYILGLTQTGGGAFYAESRLPGSSHKSGPSSLTADPNGMEAGDEGNRVAAYNDGGEGAAAAGLIVGMEVDDEVDVRADRLALSIDGMNNEAAQSGRHPKMHPPDRTEEDGR
jgi:hypothetical protein